ncbi:MAG: TIGR00300 family protein [Planctomycetes bacterium]|nr:TIGR00300 family protein [Planctomycetota bacterium]
MPQDDPLPPAEFEVVEEVEVRGHIIDSLLLPKVLDCITTAGGSFRIKNINIGQGRADPSFAAIEVRAATDDALQQILAQIADHGAVPTANHDCQLVEADLDGAFPEGFYSTTNQRTEIRLEDHWLPVANQEMDCGITVNTKNADLKNSQARCLPMSDVERGMPIVVGHLGTRVFPHERTQEDHAFGFMNSAVSTEKPKGVVIRQIAKQLFDNRHGKGRHGKGKALLVGGPAIVHTGSGNLVSELLRDGYINRLFAGNALATHDIEQALFGTSLGVNVDEGSLADAGHEHHLRAINRIRRAGSIAAAVESGVLESGIMYECVKNGVDFHLAGSIRDDGPLPDVVTDSLESQRIMRSSIRDVTFCLMIATTLHSIAVGNLLPAWVPVVCIDINPSAVIKLNDRGSFQTIGLVTDVEPFLRSLLVELRRLEGEEMTNA